MISDARVLDPSFVPQDVVHRAGQINHLTGTLKPIVDGEFTEPSSFTAPQALTRRVSHGIHSDRLRETLIDVETQYVNCWDES